MAHNHQGAGSSPAPAPTDEFANVKRWNLQFPLETDAKGIVVITDENKVIRDYHNVTIKGYLSTFEETTKADRQGDYVIDGAFNETIKQWLRKNPMMLRDHVNMVEACVGSFTKAFEDKHGLFVEGMLSNAPDVISVRFKVAEGHLKTMSMGGIFHYKEDGRGIFKVDLWEGSLTPLPANPDALFSTRSLNDIEKRFIKSAGQFRSFQDFQASEIRARTPNKLAA